MRLLWIAIVVAACSGGKSSSSSSPPALGPPAGSDTSMSGPAGGSDTSVSPPSGGGIECAKEIAIKCAQGVDGCDKGTTLFHHCVPGDATAGPPCEQEIARQCPSGQMDACLKTPRVANTHICVY